MLSIFLLLLFIPEQPVQASLGDRLVIFQNYVQSCVKHQCSSPEKLHNFALKQPTYLRIFGWDCYSECKYQSQWYTIEQFKYEKVKKIPQFYGKWTFYRLFGIQEPASFLFSLLNLFSNLYGWSKYSRMKTTADPFYNVWRVQTLITLHAWAWSAIYHGRDTPFTEKMDYFSAYAVVLYSLCAIFLKLFCEQLKLVNIRLYALSIVIPFVAFYLYHIHYLYFVRFDYGYNMKVNVFTGLVSTFLWLSWCFVNRNNRSHIWKCIVVLILVNLFLLFELFDFPPLLFTFDAHSIWHLCTFPLPLLWFSFLKEEAIYLDKIQSELNKKLP